MNNLLRCCFFWESVICSFEPGIWSSGLFNFGVTTGFSKKRRNNNPLLNISLVLPISNSSMLPTLLAHYFVLDLVLPIVRFVFLYLIRHGNAFNIILHKSFNFPRQWLRISQRKISKCIKDLTLPYFISKKIFMQLWCWSALQERKKRPWWASLDQRAKYSSLRLTEATYIKFRDSFWHCTSSVW